MRPCAAFAILLSLPSAAVAQLLHTAEAESAALTCAAGATPKETP